MTYDDFHALCESRRSIRYFDEKPVGKKEIEKLLELARLAPSVENLQPWRFHVIMNPQTRHELAEASCYGNFVEGAGIFIVVTADRSLERTAKDVVWNPRELEYSCMGAMTHVILAATAMGLGTCWISLHHGAVAETLKIPKHETIVGGLMVGHYKSGEEVRSDGRNRKPLSDMVTYHE